ncbi:MAG: hypothetical protein H6670_18245 [Anaerolineaceae bacterium]|nr:hypothetical protein [Anaerolineaceae bacterium]
MPRVVLVHITTLIGSTWAMALHIFLSAAGDSWLSPERIGDALGYGLIFGHIFALMVALLYITAQKVRSFATRMVVATTIGLFLGTLAWWTHTVLYLRNTSPDWSVLLIGGAGLSVGMIAATILRLPRIVMAVITFAGIFSSVMYLYASFDQSRMLAQPPMALIYFRPEYPSLAWLVSAGFAALIAISSAVFFTPHQHSTQS